MALIVSTNVTSVWQMKMRHLLRVSGVSSFVYWLELLISDGIVVLIPVILMLILIPAFQLSSLSPPPAMGCLVIAALLHIPAGMLFSYLVSFKNSSKLSNVFLLVSMVIITSHHIVRVVLQAGTMK